MEHPSREKVKWEGKRDSRIAEAPKK